MPTVLRVGRYRFFFFSREAQEPPHIHVEAGDQYAKYWLQPVVLAASYGFRARELKELQKLVEENLSFFRRRWDEYFGNQV
ncbi:DUF4160 domain-containing protein [Gelria sp. Kuro-4]|uniref:DUF4160 domain-containing protein n=1 Tax=Gelria sp. Kuro-4 TaxID=2796927 RepID=UPI001BF0D9B3|nr:hypothetical protein kuro4_07880 [Gelria sp. Kuro-4]